MPANPREGSLADPIDGSSAEVSRVGAKAQPGRTSRSRPVVGDALMAREADRPFASAPRATVESSK